MTKDEKLEEIEEPSWIQEAVEWFAKPSDMRVPATQQEFYEQHGVSSATFYRRISQADFDARVIELALSSARKHTPDVLEALRVKGVEQGNVLALMSFLKLVVQLAEKFSHEEKKTFEYKTIHEFVARTSKQLEEKGIDISKLSIEQLTGTINTTPDTNPTPTPTES